VEKNGRVESVVIYSIGAFIDTTVPIYEDEIRSVRNKFGENFRRLRDESR
jgi:hypothetical protein